MKRIRYLFLTLTVIFLLTGCATKTVDEMYCLPRRSETYQDLQSMMDTAMYGMQYSAPLSGENQQTVQMADVDGDGDPEFLVYAKAGEERPLRILIFDYQDGLVSLRDTISCNGTAFEQVEYVQMDTHPGLEIVVGRRLSDQMQRAVSVYSFRSDGTQKLMSTRYTRFLTEDLDGDGQQELFILQPGESGEAKGIVTLYGMENDVMERSIELNLSVPAENLKRMISGKLYGGTPAVFAAGTVGDTALITDVYAVLDGSLTNVSISGESGTSVGTMRNHYIYAQDIDYDGVMELPSLIPMPQSRARDDTQTHDLILWYSLAPDGTRINKMYTYHNYVDGWYLILEDRLAPDVSVEQMGNLYTFSIGQEEQAQVVLQIETLTGENPDSLPQGWRLLHESETAAYAARLTQAAKDFGITWETVQRSFCMIYMDWNTGET